MVLLLTALLTLFILFLFAGLVISEPLLLGLALVLVTGAFVIRQVKMFQMERDYQRYLKEKAETKIPEKKGSYLYVKNPFFTVKRSPVESDVYVSGLGLHFWKER